MINAFVKILGIVILVLGLVSCDSSKVYEEYIEVENANWKKENVASFEFEATDTTVAHNVYINVRNTGSYAYSNLYLFLFLFDYW